MIYAQPFSTFYPELDGAPTGLVGTVGVRILKNSDGSTALARTTTGITEQPAGSGHYVAAIVAPSVSGEYSVIWDTGGQLTPDNTFTEELRVTWSIPQPIVTDLPYSPSIEDVAALIRARTRDKHGNEAQTFNDDTTPTGDQVQTLVLTALEDVRTRIGEDPPASLVNNARRLVAYRAAMLVELSYFPEQVREDRTAYDRLKDLYDEGMAALLAAIDEDLDTDGGTVAAGSPAYTFGEAHTTMDETF